MKARAAQRRSWRVGDEEAREVVEGIDLIGALVPVARPNVERLVTVVRKDLAAYVNDRVVYEVMDGIFGNVELPLTTNSLPDGVAWEVVKDDWFDDVSEFGCVCIDCLPRYEATDVTVYVNDRVVDDAIDEILRKLELPLTLNGLPDEVAWEVVKDDLFDDVSGIAGVSVDELLRYEMNDMRLHVNDFVVERLVDDILGGIELPICENKLDDVMFVDERELSEWCAPTVQEMPEAIKSLLRYERREIQVWVNNKFADGVMDEVYSQIELPVERNDVDRETLVAILDCGGFDDLEQFSELDIGALESFQLKLVLDKVVSDKLAERIFADCIEGLPLIPNDVDKETVDEIVTGKSGVYECLDYQNCGFLKQYRCKDRRYMRCDRGIDAPPDVSEEILNEIARCDDFDDLRDLATLGVDSLHLQPKSGTKHTRSKATQTVPAKGVDTQNLPMKDIVFWTPDMLKGIVDDSMLAVVGIVERSREPLERYWFKDIQFYVNSKTTQNLISQLFLEIQMPVEPCPTSSNWVQTFVSNECTEALSMLPATDMTPLSRFKVNRNSQANRNIPPDSLSKVTASPITVNKSSPKAHPNASPCTVNVEFFDFKLQYQQQKTPETHSKHQDEDKQECSDDDCDPEAASQSLLHSLLITEVLPFLPLTKRVITEDETLRDVATVLLDALPPLSQLFTLTADPLENCTPVNLFDDIPPDDIIDHLLWNDVFPFMPIIPKRRRIRDIRDTVDDIVISNYSPRALPHDESSDTDDSDYPFLMTYK